MMSASGFGAHWLGGLAAGVIVATIAYGLVAYYGILPERPTVENLLVELTSSRQFADLVARSSVSTDGMLAAFTSPDGCPPGWVSFERASGRMLVGTSSQFPFGSLGGEEEVTLSVQQIPAHSHSLSDRLFVSGTSGDDAARTSTEMRFHLDQVGEHPDLQETGSMGGGGAHNNMPPYIAIYWCTPLTANTLLEISELDLSTNLEASDLVVQEVWRSVQSDVRAENGWAWVEEIYGRAGAEARRVFPMDRLVIQQGMQAVSSDVRESDQFSEDLNEALIDVLLPGDWIVFNNRNRVDRYGNHTGIFLWSAGRIAYIAHLPSGLSRPPEISQTDLSDMPVAHISRPR